MLTLAIIIPLIGALLVALLPARFARVIGVLASAAAFAVTLAVLVGFDPGRGMQWVERVPWLPQLHSDYFVGVDGLSVLFVALTGLLTLISIGASWHSIDRRVKEYYAAFLILETGMLGVFVALDFFVFYIFWELTLIPMALLIGVWGHGRRIYSALKFFLYTFLGSLFMLVAIIALYYQHGFQTGTFTLDVLQLASVRYPMAFQTPIFLALFLAFVVKVPLWPLHTWLPDAHVDAPTAGSVILAGVLLKMGGYGLLRFALPLAPDAAHAFAPAAITLSIIAILYGALVTLVQTDLKKLVAYSSVSHMGFVVLGIFLFNPQGVQGAIIQMLAHGFNSAGLFLGVGMIYDRLHTRAIADLGGLATRMPRWATAFMLFTLASLGLPALSGFVGEFLVLLGLFRVSPLLAALVSVAIILSAWYMLWMYQRVGFTDLFGVVGQHLYSASAPRLGAPAQSGVLVTEVVPDRPAALAGLRAGAGSDLNAYGVPTGGDIIRALDGHPVGTVDAVTAYTNSRAFGSTVAAALVRDGAERVIPVQLGGAADSHEPAHADDSTLAVAEAAPANSTPPGRTDSPAHGPFGTGEEAHEGHAEAEIDDEHGDPRTDDMTPIETATVVPLILLTIAVGVYTLPIFDVLNPAVTALLQTVGGTVR